MWKPIEATDPLPPEGTLETNTLDFKGEPTDDAIEMAKDVAAMANAQGGTLLIGAYGGNRLEHYKALNSKDAKQTVARFDDAVKARCAPSPLVSPALIPRDAGFVVAINAQPFPGQVVGVRLNKSETNLLKPTKRKREIEGVAFFPVRIGSQTHFITPEQIPMFIDPKIRRVAIVLEGAVGKRAVLLDATNSDVIKPGFRVAATIDGINVLQNAIDLSAELEGKSATVPVRLPLDLIETACQVGKYWHIYLKGFIVEKPWKEGQPDALHDLKFLFYASR
jgi:Schlafen, AlbA_2